MVGEWTKILPRHDTAGGKFAGGTGYSQKKKDKVP